ncbi:hypothetical protein MJG53_016479 [Ovis ammon polii x Ovis aries]|uniref:Uncharacterized protein n=1 Tax=Ovis ammon polii x Ovis aries TaxID=2918886 RepID=A0ACB9UCF5_9CETA|nr:hypothetical protein MJG53_016479 [Ovis ammon polii x Ovis aries]
MDVVCVGEFLARSLFPRGTSTSLQKGCSSGKDSCGSTSLSDGGGGVGGGVVVMLSSYDWQDSLNSMVKVPLAVDLRVTDFYYPDIYSSPCDGEGRDSKLLLAVFYCILFVFGLLGNSLVILVLVACKKLRSVTDVYLLNLALSDLLFVFSFPFQTHYQLDQWVFGTIMCKVVSGFYYVSFFSSMFFITLMSMDRYLAVVHAVYALKVRTISMGTALSLVVWLTALVATSPLLVFYQVASENGILQCYTYYNQQTLKWKIFIHFEVNILGLLIPFSILMFCYIRILHQLRSCQNHNKTKAIKLVLIVVVASLLFWVPFNMVLFLTSLHDMHILDGCVMSQQLTYATHVTETISFTHCCVNPIIYAFMGEKFKKHLSELFRKSCSHIFVYIGRQVSREALEKSSSNHHSTRSSTIDYILITHGGALGTMIDTTLFMTAYCSANAVFTGTMTITFKSPITLGSVVRLEANITGVEGRKVFLSCEAQSSDRTVLFAEASAIFFQMK